VILIVKLGIDSISSCQLVFCDTSKSTVYETANHAAASNCEYLLCGLHWMETLMKCNFSASQEVLTPQKSIFVFLFLFLGILEICLFAFNDRTIRYPIHESFET